MPTRVLIKIRQTRERKTKAAFIVVLEAVMLYHSLPEEKVLFWPEIPLRGS